MTILETFDLTNYVFSDEVDVRDPSFITFCGDMCRSIRKNGAMLVMDPRINRKEYRNFVSTMEDYFTVNNNDREHHNLFQVPIALSPEKLDEIPLEYHPTNNAEHILNNHYYWSVGARPTNTQFEEFNRVDNILPEGFPNWKETLDHWSDHLLRTTKTVSQMIAIGFGIPENSFTSLMELAPHCLAPSSSDLRFFGRKGTVLSECHYDMNFITIQDTTRFQGLRIWLTNGRKVEVVIPEGYLLVQIGKQFEWLTAGICKAGKHEVVVTDKTIEAIKLSKDHGRRLCAVSSALFSQIASDAMLKPLPGFVGSEFAEDYPPTLAGNYWKAELARKLGG